jgi:hypothetical protein
MDGVAFATSGDGGITADYRAFLASTTAAAPASGVYAAGTGATAQANSNAYYTGISSLVPHTAPPAQLALSTAEYGSDPFNTQAGSTQAGSFGFAWHKVIIARSGNTAYWTIDDAPIVTANIGSLTLGGNNIALGMSDINTTTTRHPALLFTLIDNLTVSDVVTLPEPGSMSLLVLGGLAVGAARFRRSR